MIRNRVLRRHGGYATGLKKGTGSVRTKDASAARNKAYSEAFTPSENRVHAISCSNALIDSSRQLPSVSTDALIGIRLSAACWRLAVICIPNLASICDK
jgi:hypothetical protein